MSAKDFCGQSASSRGRKPRRNIWDEADRIRKQSGDVEKKADLSETIDRSAYLRCVMKGRSDVSNYSPTKWHSDMDAMDKERLEKEKDATGEEEKDGDRGDADETVSDSSLFIDIPDEDIVQAANVSKSRAERISVEIDDESELDISACESVDRDVTTPVSVPVSVSPISSSPKTPVVEIPRSKGVSKKKV